MIKDIKSVDVNERISNAYVPSYGNDRPVDIATRMLEDRIIFLTGEIDDNLANSVVAQLIYLESVDSEKDIYLYINSPGGVITAGMAIYDTMNYISCPVNTICIGLAASMGAFLLASGEKGKRFALPNSEIMIHQPLGGAKGQATDILIVAEHIKNIKHKMAQILSENCNQPFEKVLEDTERDNYMTAQQALEYGLIDKVYTKRGVEEVTK